MLFRSDLQGVHRPGPGRAASDAIGREIISSSTFNYPDNFSFPAQHKIQATRYTFSLAMMIINWIMIAFDYSPRAGEEREARGQNHCAPATGLAFWKGNPFLFSSPISVALLFVIRSFEFRLRKILIPS